MLDLIMVAIVVAAFVKASGRKPNNIGWGLLGLAYYILSRILFSLLLFIGYWFFSDQKVDFRIYSGLMILELFGGVFFSLVATFILGEISGLNLRRVLRED